MGGRVNLEKKRGLRCVAPPLPPSPLGSVLPPLTLSHSHTHTSLLRSLLCTLHLPSLSFSSHSSLNGLSTLISGTNLLGLFPQQLYSVAQVRGMQQGRWGGP